MGTIRQTSHHGIRQSNGATLRLTSRNDQLIDAVSILVTPLEQQLLRIEATQPCLLVHRRTFSGGHVASRAWLTHPGHRFYLSTKFAHDRAK